MRATLVSSGDLHLAISARESGNSPLGCQHDCMGRDVVRLTQSNSSIALVGLVTLVLLSFAVSDMYSRLAHHLFQAYHVPTIATTPTISNGGDVIVCRFAYWFREPHRGELIAFETSGIKSIPEGQAAKDALFVKRLVGLPNDIIEIGELTHPIEYRNIQRGSLPQEVESYSVPLSEYFLLGENSANSYDSRYWGTIRRSAIYGKVTKIYWPWNRMSTPQ
jgi:signal peptidase I